MTRCCVTADVVIAGDRPLTLIAGPCVIESEAFNLRVAARLADICRSVGAQFVYKSSFDKANRTSVTSYRGVGLDDGLEILRRIKDKVGVPVVTDIHDAGQAPAVAEVVDLVQIPAFLCRQTDLLLAAAATGRAVNVKKGPFLAPPAMAFVVDKLRSGGATEILLTERGAAFGYSTLVVDFRSLPTLRSFGCPVCFDASHGAQAPGALGDRSGGDREMVPVLARAAAAVGIDALYLEVHEDPDRALSDAATSVDVAALEEILRNALAIRSCF